MVPTSLAIQIDAGTSAGIPIAKLHDIGSDSPRQSGKRRRQSIKAA
jgi:hypothetical protein